MRRQEAMSGFPGKNFRLRDAQGCKEFLLGNVITKEHGFPRHAESHETSEGNSRCLRAGDVLAQLGGLEFGFAELAGLRSRDNLQHGI